MKECKRCGVFTADFHKNGKYLASYCRACQSAAAKESRVRLEEASPGHKARREKAWREKNPGSTYSPAKVAYARANAEKHRAWVAASTAKFKLDSPAEYTAKNGEKAMRRVAAKIQRTPAWSSPESCRAVYRARESVQAATGVRHAVDHSVPLRGKLVSGLHVSENLIVIPFAANASKGNRFDPMVYDWWPECCPRPDRLGPT